MPCRTTAWYKGPILWQHLCNLLKKSCATIMATIHWLIRIFRIFPVENGHTLWNFDTLLLKITIDS
jgi:hypothetical protein